MFYFGLFVALIGLDQVVKFVMIKYFNAYVLINSDGPFSIKGDSYMFGAFSLALMIIFLLIYKKQLFERKNNAFPVVLIMSGGVSNVIDRIARHGVVDFIDLKIWPSFNLADMLITIGIIAMVLFEINKSRCSRPFLHSRS